MQPFIIIVMSQKPPGSGLFDRFKPTANALQNALRAPRKFQGSGQSLGGGSAHTSVLSVQLNDPGPLGMGIEKTQSGGCIVSRVEPGSQAEKAGVLRGDVVCFAGSEGSEEVDYKLFLEMAKAAQRPLCFELRRVGGSTTRVAGSGSNARPAAASSPASVASTPSRHSSAATTKQSAEAYARKQAVVAAAEARDKANKAKLKPISRTKDPAAAASAAAFSDKYELPSNDPKSEVAKAAIAEAKRQEAVLAAQLGYNPYEPNTATAGQARNATTAIQATTAQPTPSNSSATPATVPLPLRETRPPEPVRVTAPAAGAVPGVPLPPDLEDALVLLVSSSAAHPTAISTLRKLVVNATTKGRDPDAVDAAKFRRVRLSNPKVSAAIVDPPGAFDLMLAFGFLLTEEDGESWLVYPAAAADADADSLPAWLPEALDRLQQSCNQ